MTAEYVAVQIFVMGLAMLDMSSDGKDLAILMPDDCGHIPLLVYPCKRGSAGCTAGEAANVAKYLNDLDNLKDGFLASEVSAGETFGAKRLDNSSVTFEEPPQGEREVSAIRRPRHHSWSRWWFHLRGELPSPADGADLFWLPSLSEISTCAQGVTPANAHNLLKPGVMTSFLRLKPGEWKSVETKSAGSLLESDTSGCNDAGTVKPYVPTSRFVPDLSPWHRLFGAPNQAAADVIVINTRIKEGSKIIVQQGDVKTVIVPDLAVSKDLLIANLVPLPGSKQTCDFSGLAHFQAFFKLFANCPPTLPSLGRLGARILKEDLRQDCRHMPAITNALSGPCPASGGGQARPLCYIPTN